MEIRAAIPDDLPGLLAIYNEVIAGSTAVYAFEPTTLAERRAWLEARERQRYPVLVAVEPDEALGFASFGDFRAWPGYARTVEHSVYVGAGRRRAGVGGALVEALLPLARALDKHAILGCIDARNEASLRLHAKLGFERVAHFREVGRKFGRWLDAVFVELLLQPAGTPPREEPG
jgi:phosphinothricin acetyltransferase